MPPELAGLVAARKRQGDPIRVVQNPYPEIGELPPSTDKSFSPPILGQTSSPGLSPHGRYPRIWAFALNQSQAGVPSPVRLSKSFEIAVDGDESSRRVPSVGSDRGLGGRLRGVLARKIDRETLKNLCRAWIRNPLNMAFLLWTACVAVSGAILFLVMTGMLNAALPDKRHREAWFEVNNQILNALFTLMCLYQHPKRCYHLVLLLRWRPDDISRLRKIYSKDGGSRPHEWGHLMMVVLLLHLNCIAQYALCGLNVGYRRSHRPAVAVAICISIAIAAPAAAGVYSTMSPLGRDYGSDSDAEAQTRMISCGAGGKSSGRRASLEKKYSFAMRDDADPGLDPSRPRWSGGLLDFWDDLSVAYLSLFCSCCVFGWNVERLGFGNMYVHIATFLLFCVAPFWIFNLAAVNIDDDAIRSALGITGMFLCLFGLLYGGFWRIQMRRRFDLPGNRFCCGDPAVADCAVWLCCCWCTLAQEVRTGNSYDVVQEKLCRKQICRSSQSMTPLPREGRTVGFNPGPNPPRKLCCSPSESPKFSVNNPDRQLPSMGEESRRDDDEALNPPSPPSMLRDFS